MYLYIKIENKNWELKIDNVWKWKIKIGFYITIKMIGGILLKMKNENRGWQPQINPKDKWEEKHKTKIKNQKPPLRLIISRMNFILLSNLSLSVSETPKIHSLLLLR